MSREEKTETIYGVENTIPLSLRCFARVRERHDSCGDDTLPSVIVTTKPIKNAYEELLRRGIKTRFITEITEKNIEYCIELMKIVHELRHLEGVKGNFGVSESDYIATVIQQESHPISQLIHSNARGMIEQQKYLFESLWNKAMHAEQRMREIEQGIKPEVSEVISGPENTIRLSLECFATVKKRHDTCGDHTLPSVIISTEPIRMAYLELKNKGVLTRFITEITKENIYYCKELVKIMQEVRHLDGVKGNFAVGEQDYMASATSQEAEPISQIIHSNVRAVIEQQQYIFETLWSKAIPARQRIREIEQGAKTEFVETVRDSYEYKS